MSQSAKRGDVVEPCDTTGARDQKVIAIVPTASSTRRRILGAGRNSAGARDDGRARFSRVIGSGTIGVVSDPVADPLTPLHYETASGLEGVDRVNRNWEDRRSGMQNERLSAFKRRHRSERVHRRTVSWIETDASKASGTKSRAL